MSIFENDAVKNMLVDGAVNAAKDFAEDLLSGKDKGEGQKEEDTGNVVGNLMKSVAVGSNDNGGGAGELVGNLVKSVTGGQDKNDGDSGLNVSKVLGGLF